MFDPRVFVEECRAALDGADPRCRVRGVVERAVAAPSEVAAAFDDSVTRQTNPNDMGLLWSDELTIFRVALDPGVVTPPHDHGLWTCVGVYAGREDNVLYEERDTWLQVSGSRSVGSGEVLELAPKAIHAIQNVGSDVSMSLHVYLGPLHKTPRHMWHPRTWQREDLDVPTFRLYEKLMTSAKASPLVPMDSTKA